MAKKPEYAYRPSVSNYVMFEMLPRMDMIRLDRRIRRGYPHLEKAGVLTRTRRGRRYRLHGTQGWLSYHHALGAAHASLGLSLLLWVPIGLPPHNHQIFHGWSGIHTAVSRRLRDNMETRHVHTGA